MSVKNVVSKSDDPCPNCGGALTRITGPAEERKRTWDGEKTTLYVVYVQRCIPCNYTEVLEKVDIQAELSRLFQKKIGPVPPPPSSKPAGPSRDFRFHPPKIDDLSDDGFWPR